MQVKVQLDGEPLRYTFVSYQPDFENPRISITDGKGIATIDGVKKTDRIDIIVHAQNLAVRMLEGDHPAPRELSLRFKNKTDGSTLNVTDGNRSFDHYRIMDRCYDVYETVFRGIAPFTGRARQEYPFGGRNLEPHELKRKPGVDCRFPEKIAPGKLPWVQPQSLFTNAPLMHLKSQKTDARLFGSANKKATFIPHEYAHALHFASLSKGARITLAIRYGAWIVGELANGRPGTHRTDKETDSLIAFIEAFGIFSQRFYFFAKEARPDLGRSSLRKAFVDDELSGSPTLQKKKILKNYTPIATKGADGVVRPELTGSKTEGAVYGAIFLDFASRTSLSTAVNLFLRCGKSSFGGYADFAREQRRGDLADEIDAVAKTWKMQ